MASSPDDVIRRGRIGTGLWAAAVAYLVAAATMGLVFASRPPARLLEGLADYQQGAALYQWVGLHRFQQRPRRLVRGLEPSVTPSSSNPPPDGDYAAGWP